MVWFDVLEIFCELLGTITGFVQKSSGKKIIRDSFFELAFESLVEPQNSSAEAKTKRGDNPVNVIHDGVYLSKMSFLVWVLT
jgi:hypothetical protein